MAVKTKVINMTPEQKEAFLRKLYGNKRYEELFVKKEEETKEEGEE